MKFFHKILILNFLLFTLGCIGCESEQPDDSVSKGSSSTSTTTNNSPPSPPVGSGKLSCGEATLQDMAGFSGLTSRVDALFAEGYEKAPNPETSAEYSLDQHLLVMSKSLSKSISWSLFFNTVNGSLETHWNGSNQSSVVDSKTGATIENSSVLTTTETTSNGTVIEKYNIKFDVEKIIGAMFLRFSESSTGGSAVSLTYCKEN